MSMSSILPAFRGAGRQKLSASIVAARPVTGSHMFRIEEYSRISKMLGTKQAARSDTFTVGGHDWRIKCFPNGCIEKHKGSISLFLQHASHAKTGDATAKPEMSILVDGMSKPLNTKTVEEYCFSEDGATWGWLDFIRHRDLNAQKHLYLKDDCLTILCDVTVSGPHIESRPVASPVPPFDLRGPLAEAFWNNIGLDVEIEVAGQRIPAHRCILEARSPVFKADLKLASVSNSTALLRVDDMDAEVVKALLQFIYTDSPPPLEAATMAERLLVAADRYELEKLKLVCEEALCRHIDMSSVAAALALAERHDCSVLRAACMQFLSSPGNVEALMAVDGAFEQLKTGCPSALVDLIVKNMARREQL